jgi:hypothetical protein
MTLPTPYRAVLQKHEKEDQEQNVAVIRLRLDGSFEQFGDEHCLAQTLSSALSPETRPWVYHF